MDIATDFRSQVREAIEATHFIDDGYLSWFGATTQIDCPSDEVGRLFRHELETILYRDFYTRGRATPTPPERRLSPADLARRDMIARYIGVVDAAHRVVSGLPVVQSTDTHVRIDLNGLHVEVPSERIASRPSATEVSLTMRRVSTRLSPGFVAVFGDLTLSAGERGLRTYLNTTPDGAVECMRLLPTALNDADVAFAFKALDDSSRFSRADACVLYTAWQDRALVTEIVLGLAAKLGDRLKPAVPALTLPLAPGIGIAEGSGDDSFGRTRSTMLANALVGAWESGLIHLDEREVFVTDVCRSQGVDLEHPYLRQAVVGVEA